MFCRVTTPVRIFGAAFALVSATLFVAAPVDDASAKGFKFRSSSKSSSKSDADASGPSASKHGEGEAGSASEGGGWTFRPRSRRSSEDESAEKSDETPADAQTASEPAAPETPVASAKPAPKPAEPEKQHPLAAPHKGMDVTVCEAGCANEKQQVVYMQPTTDRRATQSELQPASSTTVAAADDSQMIRCIGGCYDTPRVYASTLALAKSQEDTQWLSTVRATGAKKGKGSGAWLREIDQSRGAEPAPSAPAAPVPAGATQ